MKNTSKIIGISVLIAFTIAIVLLGVLGDKGNEFKQWEENQKKIELYNAKK